MLRPVLPKHPIKLMLLTSGVSAGITLGLVLLALSLGIGRAGDTGRVWLFVALCINAPGALVLMVGGAFIVAATGRLGAIPDLTFVILSACISTMVYGFAGLWLGVVLQCRRIRREMEKRSEGGRGA